MSLEITMYAVLYFVLAASLGFWGVEDKEKYEVHGYTIFTFSAIYWIFYVGFLISSYPYSLWFLGIGIGIAGLAYLALSIMPRRLGYKGQLAGFDYYVVFISSISFPFLSLPALLLSLGYTYINREASHEFVWVFTKAFIAVSVLEAIGLYKLLGL